MSISGLTHAASAPALLRFAFRVATHAQGWLPAGWLAFTGRESNPLDHFERFQIIRSSSTPVLLTLRKSLPRQPHRSCVRLDVGRWHQAYGVTERLKFARPINAMTHRPRCQPGTAAASGRTSEHNAA